MSKSTNARSMGRRLYPRVTIIVCAVLLYITHAVFSSQCKWDSKNLKGLGLPSCSDQSNANVYIDDVAYPETRWVKGIAGFNYFYNLYLSNGTFVIVTSDSSHLPEKGVSYFFSGLSSFEGEGRRNPAAGEDRFMIVTPEEAKARHLLRGPAVRKTGVSMFFNDIRERKDRGSFLNHYFHFIGEMFLGAWRVVASVGEAEPPARLMFRADGENWRDPARITTWFMQSVLPNTQVEETGVFEDRAKSQMTFLFEKIVLADRWAAHREGQEVKWWNKANADLPLLEVPRGWMDPLRDQIKRLSASGGCTVARQNAKVPVVVYINRQLTNRRLNDEDAEALLDEMEKLDQQGLIEFYNAKMENLHRVDQFCLAAKADIMLGVHGNGLSHSLWMKPGSGVLELMQPPGFARDYAILSELMGHEYYAIHENTTFPPDQWRRPDGWAVDQGPDFHGSNIRVDAKWLAGMVKGMAASRVNVVEPALGI